MALWARRKNVADWKLPHANTANITDASLLERHLRLSSKIERTLSKQTTHIRRSLYLQHLRSFTHLRRQNQTWRHVLWRKYLCWSRLRLHFCRASSEFELPRDPQGKGNFWTDVSQHRSHAAAISCRQLQDIHLCRVLSQPRQLWTSHSICWRRRSLSQWHRQAQHPNHHGNCQNNDVVFGNPLAGCRRPHSVASRRQACCVPSEPHA